MGVQHYLVVFDIIQLHLIRFNGIWYGIFLIFFASSLGPAPTSEQSWFSFQPELIPSSDHRYLHSASHVLFPAILVRYDLVKFLFHCLVFIIKHNNPFASAVWIPDLFLICFLDLWTFSELTEFTLPVWANLVCPSVSFPYIVLVPLLPYSMHVCHLFNHIFQCILEGTPSPVHEIDCHKPVWVPVGINWSAHLQS